ncbi:MAG: PrsW family intramembrane metalloprotease, partial [Halarchaeum sp.]
MDRRTAVLLAVALIVLAALAPLLVAYAPTPGAGVYRVAVADDDPYRAPVDATPQLRAVDPRGNAVASGRADVAIGARGVRIADTEKGRAALATVRDAVTAYNDRVMASEGDQAAAFPVVVNLTYVERSAVRVGGTAGAGGGSSGPSGTTTDATSAGTTSATATSTTTSAGTTSA